MILVRVDNPEFRTGINLVIERIYMFADKDRSYCDFSKLLALKLLDLTH